MRRRLERAAGTLPVALPAQIPALLHGEQHIGLKLPEEGMGYAPPLSDKTYPDDALIKIKFVDEAAA
ncbi:hypothetical protein LJR289_003904 [Pseudoduganella sp. LjRoot289]|uniref:hypothetical protein n=1 Tax=Pseudoduganella sp. LjRoot289 TaxID=3342314 RepID=UPI003ECE0E0C